MLSRTFLSAKLHHATITQCDLHYEGSLTIDVALMQAVGLASYEQVHVYNMDNGHRFVTYAIPGPACSGVLCANGACAHLNTVGDRVIVCAYASCVIGSDERDDAGKLQHVPAPKVLILDKQNRVHRQA